ncbi:ABC transporter ATP-binding protein [Maribacter algicola]|uniref:ABC transporter ATP-binding protein n=1 Tax=Maribacter algicola TaxID=2498892 RepID=A0A3R8PWU8_9FLAO|nr:ABC transporter ATP-binding protein [Maribacter algicola]RRQ48219.1 ABC transporter ATP-binding protein [Maribacter algicola]
MEDKKNIREAKPVLEVRGLSIGYHKKDVCKNLSFSLDKGECTAIVGINGIGKSTLLRTLGNLQPPLEGNVCIDGTSMWEMKPNQLAQRISVVLTETVASKNLTVQELVALGRQPYTNWIGSLNPIDSGKIIEAIELLELKDLRDKKCHELSDGQLQRVMIARALAQDTDIILLDEPTTHLDLFHKVAILKLLKSIAHSTQKTILFTTHEIEMAIQMCDKILILDGSLNPFDAPCKLIESASFERLFPSDTVQFDANTGTFRIQK